MAKCKKCGSAIEFKTHPKNPDKMAPFDTDGEIHFARCKSGKIKKEYDDIGELPECNKCHLPIVRVYLKSYETVGHRLVACCPDGHRTYIPISEKNRRLINTDREPQWGVDYGRGKQIQELD